MRRFFLARAHASRFNISLSVDGKPIAHIEKITTENGTTRIIGNAFSALKLSTERSSTWVQASQAGGEPFERILEAGGRLEWEAQGLDTPENIPLYGIVSYARAFLHCFAILIAFPVLHWQDWRLFVFRGDMGAGGRLEQALLPSALSEESSSKTVPQAAPYLFGAQAYPMLHETVTVIFPVFNALTLATEALECLDRNTELPYHLIIVDDASTDPDVLPFLQTWAESHDNAHLIANPENLGFIASVNSALRKADGHVVLLNSDAFVPPHWLGRLIAPIIEDESVASVTPMSNDAEIFSVPFECTALSMAAADAEALDAASARLNWRRSMTEVPTGVGFCMAMSAHWLRRLPEFDLTFGKGYGEEVDWCRKVASLGAKHVGIGSLFVRHQGGSSFGDEKTRRVNKNNQTIAQRYPTYDQTISDFRGNDPLVGPRLALGLALCSRETPLKCYLAHTMGGGAELWLEEEIERSTLAGDYVLVIREDTDRTRYLLELHGKEKSTLASIRHEELSDYLRMTEHLDAVYSCSVGNERPLTLVESVAEHIKAHDGTLTILFHDYFPLCPSWNLIDSNGAYCNLPSPAACQGCYQRLITKPQGSPPTIASWRSRWGQLMHSAEKIVVFSNDSRDHVLRVYPDVGEKIETVPHVLGELPRALNRTVKDDHRLTVGLLGGIGYPKGAKVVRDLASVLNSELKFVIIGELDPAFHSPHINIHGPYQRAEIADLAEFYGIDCWLFPSIWPETFSYSVRECLATRLPVVGFELGAQAEILNTHEYGETFPVGAQLTAKHFRDIVNKHLTEQSKSSHGQG